MDRHPSAAVAPVRMVVTIGAAGPVVGDAPQEASRRTTADEIRSVVDAECAARRQRRRDAEEASAAARAALDGRLAALHSERQGLQAHRDGTTASADQQAAGIAANVGRRHDHLRALAAATDAVGAAVGEWQRIIEQHHAAESALSALQHRLGDADGEPAAGAAVLDEVGEAEVALQRSELGRREALRAAVSALTEAVGVLEAETEPLLLAGLLRARAAAQVAAAERRLAEIGALEAALGDERNAIDSAAGAAGAGPALADVVVGRLLAPGAAPILDDALADLDDELTTAVLDGLAAAAGEHSLTYLTDDVRVLSWAIGLPPELGRVAGAVQPAGHPE